MLKDPNTIEKGIKLWEKLEGTNFLQSAEAFKITSAEKKTILEHVEKMAEAGKATGLNVSVSPYDEALEAG